ncbi:MAG: slipin family protein [Peptococcaceae bacterium]|nr:MAG: slipin family protein [Peptococcaceae bacterium]
MEVFSLVFILVVVFMLLAATIKIVQEYERGVVFRLGRCVGARGPGLIILIPVIERMQKVDLRVITMDVPSQEAITSDNVTIKVNAIVYFQVVSPVQSVVNVLDFIQATSQLSQTTLRSVMGQSELDEILSKREEINQRLQKTIDEGTEPWGIKVSLVEIRDLELPSTMQRAMAAQAEAERERRAKIIHADGEYQAAERLAEAAKIIAQAPAALQLRYLQTLREISTDKSSTIVFPLPVDLLTPFIKHLSREGKPEV